MQKFFIKLRGQSFPVEFSTDIHIKAIEAFVSNPVNSRQRQKDIAHAVQSLCPSIPPEWASVTEQELPNGNIEIKVAFNLNVHELIEIAEKAALSHVANLIVELQASEPITPESGAKIRNKIADLQKYLKQAEVPKESYLVRIIEEGQKAVEAFNALPESPSSEDQEQDTEDQDSGTFVGHAATAASGNGFEGKRRPRRRD